MGDKDYKFLVNVSLKKNDESDGYNINRTKI